MTMYPEFADWGYSEQTLQESRELLIGAAEYISENGHTKDTYFGSRAPGDGYLDFEEAVDRKLPACARGAINAARILKGKASVASIFAAEHLLSESILPGPGLINIARWNDNPETSAEDVILALKKAGTDG